ncbi:MAG: 4-(cytidine 5'-diphospho)-2-C-methyl-D-erythritol kinase [Spirochaetales bacterium]|nr:4-(cytidine 5'-diphospho)-2-C-methyl-D-erythritol kinase [Spirochaetales bacterium]
MNRETVVYSPAKINVHLDIKEPRPDGFHNIISLFHKVDLYDEIKISSLKNADNCSIIGDFDCPPADNLIIKAARAFLDLADIQTAYEFTVHKRIPAGAGLGGGSGNAAAVLNGLNQLNGEPLSMSELYRLGETLGSDVPFFLGGSSALVTGRGENLRELSPLKGFELVLVVPEIVISTKYAYELFDREGRVNNELDAEQVEKAYLQENCRDWPFFNSFWETIGPKFSELNEAYRLLSEENGDFISMSGSGSSVFGLFSDENQAEKAFIRIKQRFNRVWKIKLLA